MRWSKRDPEGNYLFSDELVEMMRNNPIIKALTRHRQFEDITHKFIYDPANPHKERGT